MEKLITVDADVISHFIRAGAIMKLPSIFKSKLVLLSTVYDELCDWKSKRAHVDNLINFKLLAVTDFQTLTPEVKKEYFKLKKERFGSGESACMAYARFNEEVVGSNNLRDIKEYCEVNEIEYLTTMDFLCRASANGVMSEQECDEFIKSNTVSSRRCFPVEFMHRYNCKDTSLIP